MRTYLVAAVRDMFRKCNFYEKVPEDHLYLTIHDAVIAALSQRRDLLDEVRSAALLTIVGFHERTTP